MRGCGMPKDTLLRSLMRPSAKQPMLQESSMCEISRAFYHMNHHLSCLISTYQDHCSNDRTFSGAGYSEQEAALAFTSLLMYPAPSPGKCFMNTKLRMRGLVLMQRQFCQQAWHQPSLATHPLPQTTTGHFRDEWAAGLKRTCRNTQAGDVLLCTNKERANCSHPEPCTFVSCCSEGKPSPNTVLALLSAHCPNFCDVFVKVMLGVMVLFMITWPQTEQKKKKELKCTSHIGNAYPSNGIIQSN